MQNRRKAVRKQGISPVIASIILIAVTIAIAIAVAGFVFGLFGTYASGRAVSQVSATFTTGGVLQVKLHNSGTTTISVTAVTAGAGSALGTVGGLAGTVIAPNSDTTLTATVATPTVIVAGTAYSFSISLSDGSSLSVVVTAT